MDWGIRKVALCWEKTRPILESSRPQIALGVFKSTGRSFNLVTSAMGMCQKSSPRANCNKSKANVATMCKGGYSQSV